MRRHFNPETGKEGECRAKTPESCTLRTAEGNQVPHFNSKAEAEAFVEGVNAAKYGSFSTVSKKGHGRVRTVITTFEDGHVEVLGEGTLAAGAGDNDTVPPQGDSAQQGSSTGKPEKPAAKKPRKKRETKEQKALRERKELLQTTHFSEEPEHNAVRADDDRVWKGGEAPEVVYSQGRNFYRQGVPGGDFYELRIQANRPISDEEMQQMAQLTGYKLRSTIAGEDLGNPVRDTEASFIAYYDSTKSARDDLGEGVYAFEEELPSMMREGTPIRKTDRAGAGTKGTRLVEGMGEDLGITIYYA